MMFDRVLLRSRLEAILAMAAIAANFTPTLADDMLISFLKQLIAENKLEQVLDILEASKGRMTADEKVS
jgi:hypothetical protein